MAAPVGPPSQKGPTFKQPTRPAQTKDPKGKTIIYYMFIVGTYTFTPSPELIN